MSGIELSFPLVFFPPSDPLLYGGAHLPYRLLHQRGGGSAVQAAQQHGGRLLVRPVCALHLLHHSGIAVRRQSLPPGLRTGPCPPLDWLRRLLKILPGIAKKNTQWLKIKDDKLLTGSLKRGVFLLMSWECGASEYIPTLIWKQSNEQNTTGDMG